MSYLAVPWSVPSRIGEEQSGREDPEVVRERRHRVLAVIENEDLLALEVDADDACATVSVTGELDPHTVPDLEQLLTDLIGADASLSRVTLDLSGVRFIDSSGLRVVLAAHEALRRRDGRLVLRAPSETTRRLLEITDLLGRLDVEQA